MSEEKFYPVKLYNPETGEPNKSNVSAYCALTGETVNVEDAYTWELLFEGGSIPNCESYSVSPGNNLLSFKWGTGSSPTLDALGGDAFATLNFNFILGQGFGLFNRARGFVLFCRKRFFTSNRRHSSKAGGG